MLSKFRLVKYLNKDEQSQYPRIDFAFVTALPKERDAILKLLGVYEIVQVDLEPLTYYRGRIAIPTTEEYYEVVVIMLLGMGNVDATVSSMEVIKRWHPACIIMVGIAGGVPGKTSLGDIVIAKFTYYYELAKRTAKGDQHRIQQFPSDCLLYDRALAYEASEWRNRVRTKESNILNTDRPFPKVHFGAIASGEKVIADAKTLSQLLHECSELFAVAMEGVGVAKAAARQDYQIRFLEVRSICDHADIKKNDDWQILAAEAAADFIIDFLRSRPLPPLKTGTPLTKYLLSYEEPLESIIVNEEVNQTQTRLLDFQNNVKAASDIQATV